MPAGCVRPAFWARARPVSVLFVCLGNICRSPAAEAVFAAAIAADDLNIGADSAGTSDWHLGKPPYRPMIDCAARRGIDMTHLRARQFEPSDFDRFDLIIAMDAANQRDIETLRPPGDRTPVQLFLDYAPQVDLRDVPDPYYTRDFDTALDLIQAATSGLVASLR